MTKKIKIRHKNKLTYKAQKRYNTCKEQTYKLPVASWRKGKGEMTIEEIRKLISEAEYDYIGIRADDRDYQIGEVMDNSHQLFQDPKYADFECTELLYPYISDGPYTGFYDGGELDGTCALETSENNIKERLEAVRNYGERIYLIGGNSMEYGNDEDEIIIRNAKVITILR